MNDSEKSILAILLDQRLDCTEVSVSRMKTGSLRIKCSHGWSVFAVVDMATTMHPVIQQKIYQLVALHQESKNG